MSRWPTAVNRDTSWQPAGTGGAGLLSNRSAGPLCDEVWNVWDEEKLFPLFADYFFYLR